MTELKIHIGPARDTTQPNANRRTCRHGPGAFRHVLQQPGRQGRHRKRRLVEGGLLLHPRDGPLSVDHAVADVLDALNQYPVLGPFQAVVEIVQEPRALFFRHGRVPGLAATGVRPSRQRYDVKQ